MLHRLNLSSACALVLASIACSQPALIPPSEARARVGETCSVEFVVKSTGRANTKQGPLIFLNSATNPRAGDALIIVLDRDAAKKIEASGVGAPDKYYSGKQIRITGLIQQSHGAIEIHPTDPGQLLVTDANPPVDPREIPPPPDVQGDDFDPRPPSYLRYYLIGTGLLLLGVWYVAKRVRSRRDGDSQA